MTGFNIKSYFVSAMLVLSWLAAPQAFAHKVNLFAYAEGDQVYVEGYFVDGKAAQNSEVQVLGPNGDLLLEGTTDDQGQYRFAVPQRTDLKIIVNAGMGHQTDFLLSAVDLNDADADADVVPLQSAETGLSQAVSHTPASAATDNSEIDVVVRKAVNEAIKPLVRELSASQQKASLSSIVGGVGYIIGFLGLFAFFKARQSTVKLDAGK